MRRGPGPGRGRAGSQTGCETYDQAKDEPEKKATKAKAHRCRRHGPAGSWRCCLWRRRGGSRRTPTGIEEHAGASVEELTEEELVAAMKELGIQSVSWTRSSQAIISKETG